MGFLDLFHTPTQCSRCKQCGETQEIPFKYDSAFAQQFYKELGSQTGKYHHCPNCGKSTYHGLASYDSKGIEGRRKLYNDIKSKIPSNKQSSAMDEIHYVTESKQTVKLSSVI
ncbi:hypothetical protein PPERSA_08592 [Pseudocohnilembus persalinus]|uniref:Uncharacterized protein n=1 Tax=Pseudocohnilembus persalinus TaxID=266149 RepID=A0A0V0R1J7_PSEPJ|nr:hypothetical protein PPERSA_08592 [Pseudocohnilembus persalinus]|eukprot:KRX08393.1 hypothetical protein PPERSA_08592 [Pseudocohnilembus persalinus]